jgi:predicted nucleic acid-binding protein
MSRYLLDTGVLNAFLRGRPGAVGLIDPWVSAGDAFTSVLVYGEIVEYLQGLPTPDFERREAELRELLRDIHPLPLTYAILRRYAMLRRSMRPTTGLIGDVDTLIAATALERELTVVTIDGDFARVPGLAPLLLPRSAIQ